MQENSTGRVSKIKQSNYMGLYTKDCQEQDWPGLTFWFCMQNIYLRTLRHECTCKGAFLLAYQEYDHCSSGVHVPAVYLMGVSNGAS